VECGRSADQSGNSSIDFPIRISLSASTQQVSNVEPDMLYELIAIVRRGPHPLISMVSTNSSQGPAGQPRRGEGVRSSFPPPNPPRTSLLSHTQRPISSVVYNLLTLVLTQHCPHSRRTHHPIRRHNPLHQKLGHQLPPQAHPKTSSHLQRRALLPHAIRHLFCRAR
jgi:hypothetical protein